MKSENQAMELFDVKKPAVSLEYVPQVVEAMRSTRQAMFFAWLFQNVDSQELVDEQAIRHEESLSNIAYFVLRNPQYEVISSCWDVNFHYNVLTPKKKADVVAHCKRVMRPRYTGHMFRSELQFGRWYRMQPGTRDQEGSTSAEDKGGMTKDGKKKKKEISELATFPQHYTREVLSMISTDFRRKTHRASVCKRPAHFGRRRSPNENVLSHVN